MSDLVTGEAVVLGLREAKLPSRALARLLDGVIQVVAWFVLAVVFSMLLETVDEAAVEAIALSVFVLLVVVVPVVVETLSKGRSPGKAAFGLRVVRVDGGPIRFRHALVRGLVGVVDFGLMGVPAVVSSLVSPQGRRLGDVFAGTLVVRERLPRVAREQGVLPPVPPQLLNALSADLLSLEVSAVPDRLWLAVRQYLGRMRQLDPAVAAAMAQQLATDLTAHTGRPVPYGVPPAAYLGAVLVERQRREWVRATAAGEIPQMYAAPFGQPPGYGGQPAYGQAPGYGGQQGYGQPVPQPQVQQPQVQPQPSQPGGPPVRVLGYPAPQPASTPPVQATPVTAPVEQSAPEPSAGGFAPPA
ncbi:RDD family protein [Kitasatospora sp. NPDC048365]|uniref:RDD family protein n=1 Tax=Kitasatospora sp. NPDC048365 TaxID=3364050 RepID=UPI0037211A49